LLDHQNKHVERLSVDDKHSSNQFEYQNYFDASSKKNVAGKSKNVGKNNVYLKFLKFYCTYWRIEYMCYTIFC